MSLFPTCKFEVLLPGGVITPGERVNGVLVVHAPEPIPRAELVNLAMRSAAWAGYGSGKNRTVERRHLFFAPLHVDLPQEILPAGTHRYPFSIDVPAGLPPGFVGPDCAIEHVLETSLDVDWARDPKASFPPFLKLPPRDGLCTPTTTRSPSAFHDSIVVEVTLASSVIVHGEPLTGQIALRGGQSARFDAIDLKLSSVATIHMGRGDRREAGGTTIRIPAHMLRSGEPVPFAFPAVAYIPPSFRSSVIDHDVVLKVSVDIPWAFDPSFELRLDVLPLGSTVHGDANASPVGGERLRALAASMARASGLRVGRAPVLVEGAVGPVSIRVTDAPREGRLGVDVDLIFPSVELGIAFRPMGMLDGLRESPLLPASLRSGYLLRCSPPDERPRVDDGALASFMEAVLAELGGASEVRLADHHLGMHFPIQAEREGERMVQAARFAAARAAVIAAAIAQLPFPAPMGAAEAAWRAAAAAQDALLVPTGPTLHRIVLRARVLGGEERVVGASIATAWTKTGPVTRVHVDLQHASLPKTAFTELAAEQPSARLRAVRAVFPDTDVGGHGDHATLERPGFTANPAELLPAIEAFFAWVLEVRGERRADSPYR